MVSTILVSLIFHWLDIFQVLIHVCLQFHAPTNLYQSDLFRYWPLLTPSTCYAVIQNLCHFVMKNIIRMPFKTRKSQVDIFKERLFQLINLQVKSLCLFLSVSQILYLQISYQLQIQCYYQKQKKFSKISNKLSRYQWESRTGTVCSWLALDKHLLSGTKDN